MKQIIEKKLECMGFKKTIHNDQIEKLIQLSDLTLKWNKKNNLISKDNEKIIWERHIFDSLEALKILQNGNNNDSILDMGSGTGFPLIPLTILFPNLKFSSIEPREKRVRILRQFKRDLNLKNLKLNIGKTEDYLSKLTANSFDFVSSRALGNLNEDWQRANSFLKEGGKFITFKSSSEKEIFNQTPWESIQYNHLEDSEPYYLVTREK